MKVRWTAPALRDIEAIGDHIARDNPAAAARVVTHIFDQADLLAAHPHAGRAGAFLARGNWSSPTRRLSCPTASTKKRSRFWRSSMARGNGRRALTDGALREMPAPSVTLSGFPLVIGFFSIVERRQSAFQHNDNTPRRRQPQGSDCE